MWPTCMFNANFCKNFFHVCLHWFINYTKIKANFSELKFLKVKSRGKSVGRKDELYLKGEIQKARKKMKVRKAGRKVRRKATKSEEEN